MSNFPIIAIPTLALQLFAKTIDKDLFMTTLRSDNITLTREEADLFTMMENRTKRILKNCGKNNPGWIESTCKKTILAQHCHF